MNKGLWFFVSVILFMTGCSHTIPTPQERKATAFSLTQNRNLQEHIYRTGYFDLFSYQTSLDGCKNISVFIEGDGLAWVTKSTVSSDPTPINPIGLKQMLKDSSECKVYLARPCQYATSEMCDPEYWTSHRFNINVIESYKQTLDAIKTAHHNETFSITGYSGGGAVAAIVSAKREDVTHLVTFAGNLDTQKWTELHRISPLSGSLNPADFANDLEKIPQTHYVGTKDTIIPIDIFNSYLSRFADPRNIHLKTLEATHADIGELLNYCD